MEKEDSLFILGCQKEKLVRRAKYQIYKSEIRHLVRNSTHIISDFLSHYKKNNQTKIVWNKLHFCNNENNKIPS